MTHRELAKRLQISPASLSFIINHKPGISEATRIRVTQQLEELGYGHLIKVEEKPRSSYKTLCFVVYKRHGKILNQHPFFLLLMESIEAQARKRQYNVLVSTIDAGHNPQTQVQAIGRMGVQGAIVFATEMDEEDVAHFNQIQIPWIALDNDFSYLNINTVSINNQMGTYQAIRHLVSMGHTKIGYLQSADTISSFEERERGFRDALLGFGLSFAPEHIYRLRQSEEGSYQDFTAQLPERSSLPTAFVTDDDTIAIGVMRALHEHHYRIPDDISIVGFNNRPNCEIMTPPLTSIDVPKASFGAEAVEALLRQIEKRELNLSSERSAKVRIGTQLIVRASVKKIEKQ